MSLLSQGRVGEFKNVVNRRRDTRWLIVISHIDLDSIGSAFAMWAVLVFLGCLRVEIAFCGKINHPQNKAVFDRFSLQNVFVEAESLVCPYDDETSIVLVDSSKAKDLRLASCFEGIHPCIVFDHHEGQDLPPEGSDQFFWIEKMGATCTLLHEIGVALGVAFSVEARCLMALGIHGDTKGFRKNVSPRDRQTFGALLASGEIVQTFYSLINYRYPSSLRRMYKRVLKNLRENQDVILGGAGFLENGNGDFAAVIADRFIFHCEKGIVCVWGITSDGWLRMAVRSKGALPLDVFLEQRFGKKGGGAKYVGDGEWEGGVKVCPRFFIVLQKRWIRAIVPERIFLKITQLWLEKKFFK